MIESRADYEKALGELQEFLDAPNPPPIGSNEAQRFESLLDDIEIYEGSMPP